MALTLPGPLVLLGAGKMGGALIDGWLRQGFRADRLLVVDPAPPEATAATLVREGIAHTALPPSSLPEPPSVIVLAVKPQSTSAVLPSVAAIAGPDTVVLSIAAGRTIASLAQSLPSGTAIVRAMPNTPASIGRGITVCVQNGAVTDAQRARCAALMSAAGEVAWIEDEALMDAVTAVSGSGPAYVFLLAECLAEAGRQAGLDAALARRLAIATVSGAGALLEGPDADPRVLRENVTSPGGTTAAALAVLMGPDGLEPLLVKAVLAAEGRGRELAKS